MNPALVFIILVLAFLLWLISSFLYKPIGRFFGRLAEDAKEAMFEEENNENKNNDNKGENENE